MKKLVFLIFVIFPLFVNAQRVWVWEDSINTALVIGADTLLQPLNKDNLPGGGVGSYCSSVTFDADDLNNSNSIVAIGSSNLFLTGSKKYYQFQKLDTAVLNPAVLAEIEKGFGIVDTTHIKIFTLDTPFCYEVPMIKYTTGSVSAGWLRWRWVFFKQ